MAEGGVFNVAGARGSGGAVLDASVTRTELPPRPAWSPTFPLGKPGWRNSTTPFCSEDVAELSTRVWSTNDAVYVLVGANCATLDRRFACNFSGVSGSVVLYKNDGAGWKSFYRRYDGGGTMIRGYPDGRLVLLGGDCPVTLFDQGGSPKCIWSGPPSFYGVAAVVNDAGELFVLGSYNDGSATQELFEYDGAQWTSIKTWTGDFAPGVLRTSGATVFVAGGQQYVWSYDPGSRTESQMRGVPAGGYSAAWFYGSNDFLLGNGYGGLVHYDGSQWSFLDTALRDSILTMWGASDGTVFMYSQGAIGRWKAGAFEALHQERLDASHIQLFADMWGNSSTEVFFAVNDYAFQSYACGTTFLVWFDGTAFHQF